MKIQLTKDKEIEISLPSLGGGKKKKSDIVGVELYSTEPDGCPAVRLYGKKGSWHVGAVGFVKTPDGDMPECWDDIAKQPTWEMPRNFQAPSAALAVNSSMGSFGQASPEAIVQEMMLGQGAAAATAADSAAGGGRKRFGVKRSGAPSTPQPASDQAPSRKRPNLPVGDAPVSENGRRFAVRPFAEDGFRLSASLPEFQALWLGRLLPEGRRPTASSIQLAESALMSSVLMQPEFAEAGGDMLVVFVRRDAVFFAGYKKGIPALWRRCPGVGGYAAMREAVKKKLGVEEELVDSVLDDALIDPRPALEPFLHPVFEQLELARAYLEGKHSLNSSSVMLMGLPSGAGQWSRYAEETLRIRLVSPGPFDGLVIDKGVEAKRPNAFLVALGAAVAALEVEK